MPIVATSESSIASAVDWAFITNVEEAFTATLVAIGFFVASARLEVRGSFIKLTGSS